MMNDPSIVCNYKVVRTIYPIFLCPSNPLAREICEEDGFAVRPDENDDWGLSQCDYAGNIGDYRNETGIGWGANAGTLGENVENAFGAGNSARRVRGVIGTSGWSAAFEDITDGLSNTFLLGECIGALSQWQNWGSQCFANTAHPINMRNDRLIENYPQSAGASVIGGGITSGWWDWNIGFRSRHPNGANFAMCDGSVRFVVETVDSRAYRATASRDGGESVTVGNL